MNGKNGVLAQNLVMGDIEFDIEHCGHLHPPEANVKEKAHIKIIVTCYLAQVTLFLSLEQLPYPRFFSLLTIYFLYLINILL